MVDTIAMEEKFKQTVFSEIEGPIIEPDADIKVNMITMDKEQASIDSVKQFDTFRGGTKSELFNLSRIVFQESDKKTMETIMVGAQTVKQFQSNGQKYQDDMKDNPNSEVKRKKKKSVLFQIEEEKVIEAHVTHWQTLESHGRVQQWQEQQN